MTLPRATPVPPQSQSQPRQGLPRAVQSPPASSVVWRFLQRFVISPASVDTSQFNDVPVPPNALSVIVNWRARDTSANVAATFGSLQLGVNGGAIDTGNNYDWGEVFGGFGVAAANGGASATNGISCFATAGGAQGANVWNRGTITFPILSATDQAVMEWQIIQVLNAGGTVVRNGSGNYRIAGRPTKLRFFSGASNLAIGTTFELWAALST